MEHYDWNRTLAEMKKKDLGGADRYDVWASLALALRYRGCNEPLMYYIFETVSARSASFRGSADCQRIWRSAANSRYRSDYKAAEMLRAMGHSVWHRIPGVTAGTEAQRPCDEPSDKAACTGGAPLSTAVITRTGQYAEWARRHHLDPLYRWITRMLYSLPAPDSWRGAMLLRLEDLYQRLGIGLSDEGYTVFPYWCPADGRDILYKAKYMRYGDDGHRLRPDAEDKGPSKGAVYCRPRCQGAEKLQHVPWGIRGLSSTPDPNRPLVLVESEKTALLLQLIAPQLIWAATGGEMLLRPVLECPWMQQYLRGGGIVMTAADLDAEEVWNRAAEAFNLAHQGQGVQPIVSLYSVRPQLRPSQADFGPKADPGDMAEALLKGVRLPQLSPRRLTVPELLKERQAMLNSQFTIHN